MSCPVSGCAYVTEDVEVALAVALLNLHNHEHSQPKDDQSVKKQKPPKVDRPRISKESSEETWNMFRTRWTMFQRCTQMTVEECPTIVRML